VFITEQRLVKLRALFARHGDGIIIIARFISGLRQLNGIIAGLARMKWHRFLVFNMIGAALWAGVWGGLSYMLGGSIQRLHRIFRQLEVVLLVLVLLLLVFLMVRLVLKKHKR
jgi:membrane protein DedA with SNARE-associated domain